MNVLLRLLAAGVLASLVWPVSAMAGSPSTRFGPKWQALLGEWKGENASGAAAGGCGFRLDLSDHVIVRTNHAIVAPSGGRPAEPHEDLMVIYPGATGDKAKAVYFDNEGHVIDYDAEWSADASTLTFISKPGMGPQFRLIYKKTDPNTFAVTFEMAPPGQTAFRPYTSGAIKRR